LDSNKRYWAKRLSELDGEMKTEPDRIRNLYQSARNGLSPWALVYLWPFRDEQCLETQRSSRIKSGSVMSSRLGLLFSIPSLIEAVRS